MERCIFCGSKNLGPIEHDVVSEGEDPQYYTLEDIYYRKCLDCGELTDSNATPRDAKRPHP